MEYKFTEKEENTYINLFYKVYFSSMYSELNKRDCKSITRDLAIKQREIEKMKSIKENKVANSLIGRMLMTIGVKSSYRKHFFEEYDLMLLIMRYLDKDKLDIRDFSNLDVKEFYVKCLKNRFDKYDLFYDEFRERIFNLSNSETEEKNKLFKQESELYKKLIPSYDEFEEKNGYEL